jgi:hypothetical protein
MVVERNFSFAGAVPITTFNFELKPYTLITHLITQLIRAAVRAPTETLAYKTIFLQAFHRASHHKGGRSCEKKTQIPDALFSLRILKTEACMLVHITLT